MIARFTFALCLGCLAGAGFAKGVPAVRLQRMSHGLNFGAYRYASEDAVSEPLVRALAKAGFKHVRLTVDPKRFWLPDSPAILDPDGLKRLDAVLGRLLSNHFAVSVDIHDPDKRVWNDPEWGTRFVAFWGALAKHLSKYDPNYLFLEVCNEPLSDTPAVWDALQGRCLAAMRKSAPRHTLLASPNMQIAPGNWNVLEVMKTFKPVGDTNVVYTFHYYNPFLFTHQGATWSWDGVKGLSGVPYPSSPEAVAAVAEKYPEPQKGYILQYGKERWDAAKIAVDMKPYIEWGKKYNVPLTCGEFGAYKNGPTVDRLTWLHDVRVALEAYKVPWTIWDDGGGFGVTNGKDDQLDKEALKALGLKG
ncbi:MAG TPA: cellulase family glycosylhydrolase [Armatimonadota bacterium]|jgi:aryl-phospho-beta-D-glucosidase BglC (GH1 family)